jgi:hypothetical protein
VQGRQGARLDGARRRRVVSPPLQCAQIGGSKGKLLQSGYAPVAQLDRVSASEAEGRAFESRRAHQFFTSKVIGLRAL